MNPRLSILVAARNEEASIAACVERIFDVFPDDAEVLVIGSGSDATEEVVTDLGWTRPLLRFVPDPGDRGRGHAIRVGIEHAVGRLQAQIDGDLSFRPEDLPALFAPLERNEADVVLGSRFLGGGAPLHRSVGNRSVSAYVSALWGRRFTDVLAGMKAWTREAIEKIDLRTDDEGYAMEIPCRALDLGLRVEEVPVSPRGFGGGQSRGDVLRAGTRLLAHATRMRLKKRR